MDEYAEIPQDKAQQAYNECVKDPKLARYYANAPEGARRYIALMFYFAVFGDELTDEQRMAYQQEVEAELSTGDLVYLIKQERDQETRDYFTDLLTNRGKPRPRRTAETVTSPRKAKVAAAAVERPVAPADVDEPDSGVKRLKSVSEARATMEMETSPLRNETVSAVEARWNAENRRRRMAAMWAAFKSLFMSVILLVVLAAAGWFCWERFFKSKVTPVDQESVAHESAEKPDAVAPHGQESTTVAEAKEQAPQAAAHQAEVARKDAEERRKAEETERQRSEETKEMARVRKETYEKIVKDFVAAPIDYWKNAPVDERPGRSKAALTFNCLVPEGDAASVLELKCIPGLPMVVRRITADADPQEIELSAFEAMTRDVPYLVMRAGKSWFCTPKKKGRQTYAVPLDSERFNPSKETFGALYAVMERLRIPRPIFSWQVQFLPKDAEEPVDVCVAAFGEGVSRSRFQEKVRDMMRASAESRIRRQQIKAAQSKLRKRTVVLYDGESIKKTIGGVTQVPRTFRYNSSNRHKYYLYSRSYYDEVRKEEQARARWQSLYDEAVRQERAERELQDAVKRQVSVDVGTQEVDDALKVGVVTFKPVE